MGIYAKVNVMKIDGILTRLADSTYPTDSHYIKLHARPYEVF